MRTAQTSCPNCRASLRVGGISLGARVRCPKCGNAFAFTPVVDTESGSQGPGSALEATVNQVPSEIPEGESASCRFLQPAERPDELGRLGHFRVLKELGRGGMGMVFLAEDLQLLRRVALKIMLPEHASQPAAKERFLREARTAANIENDHIIAIHEVAEDRGVPYLTMPLLKGEVLAERLRREPRLPLREVLHIAWQICDGLQAAHSRGLVHRDLKPGNIWLESRSSAPAASASRAGGSRVKILDFGLARAVTTDQQLTRTGVVLGTPSYMAPEQARDPKVDARADLFSLGVMLFQMTTGKLPFRGHDMLSVLFAISNDAPPAPNSLNPEVPQELSDLIMKLLAKKAEHRFASAHDVTEALEAIDARYFEGQAIHFGSCSGTKDLTEKEVAAKLFAFDPLPEKVVSINASPTAHVRATSPLPRRSISWKWLASGICAVIGVLLLAQLIIRIRNRDGSETKIEVPKDSTVVVENKGKAIFKVPNEKAKTKPAVAGDPHRRVAEMVLKNGGKLTLWTAKEEINVAGMKDLPKEPFLVANIHHTNPESQPIPDKALEAFEGVHYIPDINLTVADTAGLRHLRDVAAKAIALKAENLNGDECVKLLGERPELLVLTIYSSSISDAAVPLFLKMKHLRRLALTGCSKLTEAGIKELATHPALHNVDIDPIAPQAAAHFNQLPFLRYISVQAPDDAAVTALSGLTRAAAVWPGNLSDDGARRLQKALPNAVILHRAVPPTEAERSAIQWALDQKSFISVPNKWGEPIKEVPASAICLGQLHIPDDAVKMGAIHLRGIRYVWELHWIGMENADDEAEHIATLGTLLSLWIGKTTLTAKGMERLTALKQLESLTFIHIPTITTEALSHVAKFENLRGIGFNGCPVTDSGLAHLAKATALQEMTVEWCPERLTGSGLKHLASLPLLRYLNLQSTRLDENAVESLKLLTSLRVLILRNTQRTAADIAELQKALPKCAIFWDGGLIVPAMEGERGAKQP